jgi:hypothetical protein
VDEVYKDAEKFHISGAGHPTEDSTSIYLNALFYYLPITMDFLFF